jgi:hypothetical protein
MQKYSSANLLEEELSFIGEKDFLSKILYNITKTSSIILTINVPIPLYLRAEVFCEDVMELSEMRFNQNDLMNLLYNDFLLFAKKNPEPIALFHLLTSLESEAGKKSCLEQQQSGNVFKLIHREQEQKVQTLQLKFRRKHALRGEILLADMEEVQPGHRFTLEKVLTLLYCDFVDKFRKGNNTEAINAIISSLIDN